MCIGFDCTELRCSKDSDIEFKKCSPPLQNQPSVAVCNSVSLRADCGWVVNRVLRTSKLLPKVAIRINISRYTWQGFIYPICHDSVGIKASERAGVFFEYIRCLRCVCMFLQRNLSEKNCRSCIFHVCCLNIIIRR